jgi:H+/Cl- antiporter ClcA
MVKTLKQSIIFSLVIHILILIGLFAYYKYFLYKLSEEFGESGTPSLWISFDGFFSDNIKIEMLCWFPITFVVLTASFLGIKSIWNLVR